MNYSSCISIVPLSCVYTSSLSFPLPDTCHSLAPECNLPAIKTMLVTLPGCSTALWHPVQICVWVFKCSKQLDCVAKWSRNGAIYSNYFSLTQQNKLMQIAYWILVLCFVVLHPHVPWHIQGWCNHFWKREIKAYCVVQRYLCPVLHTEWTVNSLTYRLLSETWHDKEYQAYACNMLVSNVLQAQTLWLECWLNYWCASTGHFYMFMRCSFLSKRKTPYVKMVFCLIFMKFGVGVHY
jgi:hypothetical protein